MNAYQARAAENQFLIQKGEDSREGLIFGRSGDVAVVGEVEEEVLDFRVPI